MVQGLEALEPVRQRVHRCFGAIAPGAVASLKADADLFARNVVPNIRGRCRQQRGRR
jgi:hypothetical protein